MTVTTLAALPLPTPARSQTRAVFTSAMDAWMAAFPTFVTNFNTVTTEINAEWTLVNALGLFALPYTFSTTTTDADPGAGILRLSSATQNASTVLRIDLTDRLGATVTSFLDSMVTSTSTSIKGYLRLTQVADPTKWLLFSVASLASPSGYKNITGTCIGSSTTSPFTNLDQITVAFIRNGDNGLATDMQTQAPTYGLTAGTLTAYTLTPTPALGAYAVGVSFVAKFHVASGASPTLQISGLATPPNLVRQNGDGTYTNITAGEIPINHTSRVTLLSATQAWVEVLPFAVSGPGNSQLAGTRNKIINGKMDFAQRGTSFAAITNGAYCLDRWLAAYVTTGVTTVSQQADVPADNEFQNSLRVAVTTADAAVAVGDYYALQQKIEGYNIRDLIGSTFSVSFRVRSTKTGIHCVALSNSGLDRSYVMEYTISVTNTWETKTITVPGGLPTAGTWNYTNGTGLQLIFALMAGTTFQTTANAWNTGNFVATSGQVNCLDNVVNIFAITGVQLEPGPVATPHEHRNYALELAMCQRYYEKSFALTTAPVQNVGSTTGALIWGLSLGGAVAVSGAPCGYRVSKRTTPTMTFYNPLAANAFARNSTRSTDATATTEGGGDNLFTPVTTGLAGWVAGDTINVHWAASAEL